MSRVANRGMPYMRIVGGIDQSLPQEFDTVFTPRAPTFNGKFMACGSSVAA